VSIINGAICNGLDTAGCDQTPATVAAGFGAVGVAVDPASDKVCVTNTEDASVSVIDGATCNAANMTGCTDTPPKIAVGDYPGSIAVDPSLGAAYVQSIEGVSVIPLSR
jgi:serine/threonine-protein kinase